MSNTAYDITIKDYEEWLKNNKKVKVPKEGEALSTFDEQENRTLYNQYVKEANLLNQRKAQERQLAEQKAAALRDNYAASEKAEKKAEDLAKMQGITTGVSQSDLIDLYAKGAAARAGIIQANDDAKKDVFSAYSQALAESKANTNKTIADIGVKRAEKEETDLKNKKTQTKTTFKNMIDGVLSGTNSKDELKKYYKQNSEYIDDEYLISRYNNIDDIKTDKDVKAALESYGKTSDFDALKEAIEGAGGYLNDEDRRAYESLSRAYLANEFTSMLDDYIAGGATTKEELDNYFNENGTYISNELKKAYNNVDSTKASNENAKATSKANNEFKTALENYSNGFSFEYLENIYENSKDLLSDEMKGLYKEIEKTNEIAQDSAIFEKDVELFEKKKITLRELFSRSTKYSLPKETEKELCDIAWEACISGDKDARYIVYLLAATQRLSKSERTRYLNAIPKEDE